MSVEEILAGLEQVELGAEAGIFMAFGGGDNLAYLGTEVPVGTTIYVFPGRQTVTMGYQDLPDVTDAFCPVLVDLNGDGSMTGGFLLKRDLPEPVVAN